LRIVSLLPSLTELVCALGHEADLVGVTHECDFPPAVERLPRLTRSRIPTSASSDEIDAMVTEQGGALYDLDAELLAAVRPELILTQAQCDVCAVNERTVRQTAAALPGKPLVESVNPTDLAGVFAMFRRVGELLDASDAASALIEGFHATAAEIARRRVGKPAARVLHLEWFDPAYISGHWNPDLIRRAGGLDVFGQAGEPSRRTDWAEITEAAPEVVLLAPCGFSIERSEEELPAWRQGRLWQALLETAAGRVTLVDGSAYFSRPGPRLEASLRIAAAAIDPGLCGDLAAEERLVVVK
jgi:iron complex transport system substrate-binding protein